LVAVASFVAEDLVVSAALFHHQMTCLKMLGSPARSRRGAARYRVRGSGGGERVAHTFERHFGMAASAVASGTGTRFTVPRLW
jgi:hypothetical protein